MPTLELFQQVLLMPCVTVLAPRVDLLESCPVDLPSGCGQYHSRQWPAAAGSYHAEVPRHASRRLLIGAH